MAARTLPNIGLEGGYDENESGWAEGMTANLLAISTLVQAGVIDKVAATPGSPNPGDIYLFDESHPTEPNAVAVFEGDTGDETWTFYEPLEGWLVYNRAEGYYEKFDGTVWVELETGGGGGGSGVPDGGTVGQVLTKLSSTDGDADWVDPPLGGKVGAYELDRELTFTAGASIVVPFLDFVNYEYEFVLESRAVTASGNINLVVQSGSEAASPVWNTSDMWNDHTGAVAGSTSGGRARVGYAGSAVATDPLITTIRIKTTADRRTLSGHYYYANFEGRGVIAQNTLTPIGAIRLEYSGGTWTGTLKVYKIAKKKIGGGAIGVPATGAYVQRTTTQSIPDGSILTPLSFDSVSADDGAHYDPAQPTRLTAKETGWHQVSGGCRWASSTSGFRGICVTKNGGAERLLETTESAASGLPTPTVSCAGPIYLEEGDYIEFNASQGSGGALNVSNDTGRLAWASISRISAPLISAKPWYWRPPLAALFTESINGGAVALVDDPDVGLVFDGGATGGSTGIRAVGMPVPVGNWKVIAHFSGLVMKQNYSGFGFLVATADKTKSTFFNMDSRFDFRCEHWTMPGTFVSNPAEVLLSTFPTDFFMSLEYVSSTNTYIWGVSADGKAWQYIFTLVNPTHLGASPGFIGINGAYARATGPNITFSINSWSLT